MSVTPKIDPDSPEFWEDAWTRMQAESFLMNTQKTRPESWQRFYDQMTENDASFWRAMGDYGDAVTEFLFREDAASEGCTALDAGCGFGSLALPLAERGVQVTALDNSPGMLRALEKEAGHRSVAVETCLADFETFTPTQPVDLAAAACFPPAMTPEGIMRLESWSRKCTAIVLGAGKEVFPYRRALWARIMKTPLPTGRPHLMHLMGWLIAAGRSPNLRHLSYPLAIDHSTDVLKDFYIRYFTIFGRDDAEARDIIRRYFNNLASDGRIRAGGPGCSAVVWWRTDGCGLKQ